jgi:hypothetical protein
MRLPWTAMYYNNFHSIQNFNKKESFHTYVQAANELSLQGLRQKPVVTFNVRFPFTDAGTWAFVLGRERVNAEHTLQWLHV